MTKKLSLKKIKRKKIKLKYLILFFLTTGIILSDQYTKALVVEKFRLGETLPIISDLFNLTYIQNKGAAFGLMAQANPAIRVPFFIIVPLVALGSIGYVFRKIPDRDIKLAIALSLVIGGAIGNLIDRLQLGYVVDFLDFHWKWAYHFPAFNVADSAICVGVGVIILDIILQGTQVHASNPH